MSEWLLYAVLAVLLVRAAIGLGALWHGSLAGSSDRKINWCRKSRGD